MGFPILVRQHICTESGPRVLCPVITTRVVFLTETIFFRWPHACSTWDSLWLQSRRDSAFCSPVLTPSRNVGQMKCARYQTPGRYQRLLCLSRGNPYIVQVAQGCVHNMRNALLQPTTQQQTFVSCTGTVKANFVSHWPPELPRLFRWLKHLEYPAQRLELKWYDTWILQQCDVKNVILTRDNKCFILLLTIVACSSWIIRLIASRSL